MGYDVNVALDLEFTPVVGRQAPGGLRYEVIEFGAVMLTPEGKELNSFSSFVKPAFADGLTRKVRRLTGIRDVDLARAKAFETVVEEFADWMGDQSVRMITWDRSDREQILSECAAKNVQINLPARWLDLQAIYPRLMGVRRRKVSLGEAADWCGIEFDVRHRALADARATGQIFAMAKQGECAEQRRLLESEVRHNPLEVGFSSSIAERCGGLGELLLSLTRMEAA